jgi:hypothetical protein
MHTYLTTILAALALSAPAVLPLAAQTPPSNVSSRLSDAGVFRAATRVDSVFVERQSLEQFVDGADFASYLVARLGVRPVPDNLAIDVAVDTQAVRLTSRVQDLPPQVKAALGAPLMLVDPAAPIVADIVLQRPSPGVARFHLAGLRVNGFPLPEGLLGPLMAEVGARYPALTRTGRDLLVAVPEDGRMTLVRGGIRVAIPAMRGPVSQAGAR